MRRSLAIFLLCLISGSAVAQTVQVFMHCEEPSVLDTPNFKTMSPANASSTGSYIHWRNQLKSFAGTRDPL